MRGSARIYDVRMAQFALKIQKLSHIIGARGSQDLRSPSSIMALDVSERERAIKVCLSMVLRLAAPWVAGASL